MSLADTSASLLSRRSVFFVLRSIGLGLFAWTLSRVDIGTVSNSLESISLSSIAIAIVLCLALLVVKATKWRFMISQSGLSASLAESLAIYSNTTFWGTITPGRLGEFKRVWYLMKRHSQPVGRSTYLCLLDRAIDVFTVIGVTVAIGIIFPSALGEVVPLAALCAVLALCLITAIWRRCIVHTLFRIAATLPSLARWIQKPAQDLLKFRHLDFAVMVALSGAGFACYFGMVWVLLADLSLTLSIPMVIATIGATMVSALIPISFFNLGPREIVLASLFGAYGFSLEDAISYSALFIICYLILMISSGLLGWLSPKLPERRVGNP